MPFIPKTSSVMLYASNDQMTYTKMSKLDAQLWQDICKILANAATVSFSVRIEDRIFKGSTHSPRFGSWYSDNVPSTYKEGIYLSATIHSVLISQLAGRAIYEWLQSSELPIGKYIEAYPGFVTYSSKRTARASVLSKNNDKYDSIAVNASLKDPAIDEFVNGKRDQKDKTKYQEGFGLLGIARDVDGIFTKILEDGNTDAIKHLLNMASRIVSDQSILKKLYQDPGVASAVVLSMARFLSLIRPLLTNGGKGISAAVFSNEIVATDYDLWECLHDPNKVKGLLEAYIYHKNHQKLTDVTFQLLKDLKTPTIRLNDKGSAFEVNNADALKALAEWAVKGANNLHDCFMLSQVDLDTYWTVLTTQQWPLILARDLIATDHGKDSVCDVLPDCYLLGFNYQSKTSDSGTCHEPVVVEWDPVDEPRVLHAWIQRFKRLLELHQEMINEFFDYKSVVTPAISIRFATMTNDDKEGAYHFIFERPESRTAIMYAYGTRKMLSGTTIADLYKSTGKFVGVSNERPTINDGLRFNRSTLKQASDSKGTALSFYGEDLLDDTFMRLWTETFVDIKKYRNGADGRKYTIEFSNRCYEMTIGSKSSREYEIVTISGNGHKARVVDNTAGVTFTRVANAHAITDPLRLLFCIPERTLPTLGNKGVEYYNQILNSLRKRAVDITDVAVPEPRLVIAERDHRMVFDSKTLRPSLVRRNAFVVVGNSLIPYSVGNLHLKSPRITIPRYVLISGVPLRSRDMKDDFLALLGEQNEVKGADLVLYRSTAGSKTQTARPIVEPSYVIKKVSNPGLWSASYQLDVWVDTLEDIIINPAMLSMWYKSKKKLSFVPRHPVVGIPVPIPGSKWQVGFGSKKYSCELSMCTSWSHDYSTLLGDLIRNLVAELCIYTSDFEDVFQDPKKLWTTIKTNITKHLEVSTGLLSDFGFDSATKWQDWFDLGDKFFTSLDNLPNKEFDPSSDDAYQNLNNWIGPFDSTLISDLRDNDISCIGVSKSVDVDLLLDDAFYTRGRTNVPTNMINGLGTHLRGLLSANSYFSEEGITFIENWVRANLNSWLFSAWCGAWGPEPTTYSTLVDISVNPYAPTDAVITSDEDETSEESMDSSLNESSTSETTGDHNSNNNG